jgi:hypothetical protein
MRTANQKNEDIRASWLGEVTSVHGCCTWQVREHLEIVSDRMLEMDSEGHGSAMLQKGTALAVLLLGGVPL